MRFSVWALALLLWTGSAHADYRQHPEAQAFIDEMVMEHGFERDQVEEWLGRARQQESILEAIARPAERTKTWREYRPIFVVPLRIRNGVTFWREHRQALERAEREFGVPAELVVAIIGVETNYGRNMGSHRVIDALTTLAFDYPPRAPFFRSELENYLLLTREQEQNPMAFKGSYAGAMGYGQFMPSSYRNYAVDFDGDGFTDIWNNPVDAIGSVAHYFQAHGWQSGAPVAVRARRSEIPAGQEGAEQQGAEEHPVFNKIDPPAISLGTWRGHGLVPIVTMPDEWLAQGYQLQGVHGEEFWLGLQNFHVITRYNRSHMYALAVYQLSREIKNAMETAE